MAPLLTRFGFHFCLMPRLGFFGNMELVVCVVCKTNYSKYKCSTCISPYCSVGCWKIHKNERYCKVQKRPEGSNELNTVKKQKYFTEDTVGEEKLSRLGDSKALKGMLSNRHLQSTLVAVDNASNPEETLKQAMKDPEFVEFVDECLKIVEDSPE